MGKWKIFIAALVIAPLQLTQAMVVLDQFGAFATAGYADCDEPCNQIDAIPFSGGIVSSPNSVGVLTSTLDLMPTDIGDSGTAFAQATILGGLNAPLLRASADSNSGKSILAQAVAVQGYTVTGGGNGQTINAMVTLTGTVSNPNSNDQTGLAATVGMVKVNAPGDFEFVDPVLTALFIALTDPNAVVLEQTTTTGGPINQSDTASLIVDQGEQFYIVALLGAGAAGLDADAISLSTLSVQFDAASAAVLAPASVPLPASIVLLLPALALLRRQLI